MPRVLGAIAGDNGHRRLQPPVDADGKQRVIAAAVVGDREIAARSIEGEVTGTGAFRRLHIDLGEFGGGRIDGKRRRAAARLSAERLQLVDGEHEPPVGTGDQKARLGVSATRPTGVSAPEVSSKRKA